MIIADSKVDYSALIRHTPQSRKLSLSHSQTHYTRGSPAVAPTMLNGHARTGAPSVAAPKTVATVSMDIDRDATGHEHIHATLRDHTGVKKVIDFDQTRPPAETIASTITPHAHHRTTTHASPVAHTTPRTEGGKTRKLPRPRKTMVEQEIIEELFEDGDSDVEEVIEERVLVVETREERKERERREKKERKAAEKLAREREREPAFRRIAGAAPGPRSER